MKAGAWFAALLAAGESEFAARFPSLLAATLTIPVLLLWGRLLARPGAAQWAAFLLALGFAHEPDRLGVHVLAEAHHLVTGG